MNAHTTRLHDLGQSLWVDNISRGMLRREGVDDEAPALRLQRKGADGFTASWRALLARIDEKSVSPAGSGA